jgi:hypothetical protein
MDNSEAGEKPVIHRGIPPPDHPDWARLAARERRWVNENAPTGAAHFHPDALPVTPQKGPE